MRGDAAFMCPENKTDAPVNVIRESRLIESRMQLINGWIHPLMLLLKSGC